ncbi:MAG TPA: glycosyltransferase family 2 protein, partial [Casimicrobiaceae bacterium]|nr:glycosyltransferase family 2 protein [Casimicrobiaceae bacterium]
MRLFGIAVVRDEEDVLETFVRHNVQFLDHLHIAAHRCRDGSERILHSLCNEGLPISVIRRQDSGLRKADWLNELAARSFSDGADAVAALDADEFIKVADRSELLGLLDSFPEGRHPGLLWQSYVPTVALLSRAASSRIDVLRDIRHRLIHERWTVMKVILRRSAARLGWRFDEGAHRLVGRRDVCRILVLPRCRLAHFPVRSLEQFEQKIVRSWHARRIHRPMPDMSSHWRHVYESMISRGAATPQLLRRIAADYQRSSGEWDSLLESEVVE